MKKKFTIITLCAVAMLSACSSISDSDREFLKKLSALGISNEDQQVKNSALAGTLNVLPGFGNFYLAMGTSEKQQWIYGTLNLLAWPLSITWGIPSGIYDAKFINKKATAYYYQYDTDGKKRLAQLQRKSSANVFNSFWQQPTTPRTQSDFAQQHQFLNQTPSAFKQPEQFNRHSLITTSNNHHLITDRPSNLLGLSSRRYQQGPLSQQPLIGSSSIISPALLPVFTSTSVNSRVLYFVQPNATVNINAKMQNGWVEVSGTSANSLSGYMHTGWLIEWPDTVSAYASINGKVQVSNFTKGAEAVIFLVENRPGWYKLLNRDTATYKEVFVHIPTLAGAEAI